MATLSASADSSIAFGLSLSFANTARGFKNVAVQLMIVLLEVWYLLPKVPDVQFVPNGHWRRVVLLHTSDAENFFSSTRNY